MCNILTITFSPCIDKSFCIPELIPEKKLRTSIPKTEPGGGGINVARVLARLGVNAMALYPSGGYTGKALDQLMAGEHIPVISVKTQNETRESIIVLETSTNRQFRFTMPAPALNEKELEKIIERIKEIEKLDFIVISGSISADISSKIFSQLDLISRKKKAKLIVDTSGEALKCAVDHGVYLIKPNISELAYIAGKEYLRADEIVYQAKNIIRTKNCEIIVVSLNAEGAMLVTNDKAIPVVAPAVKVKSTVGAGDSMVAGVVFALSTGNDIETATQYGVACGTAATLNAGTELCYKKDVEDLFDEIRSLPKSAANQ
jgi:6-phosphofructokinase 2